MLNFYLKSRIKRAEILLQQQRHDLQRTNDQISSLESVRSDLEGRVANTHEHLNQLRARIETVNPTHNGNPQ